VKKRITIEQYLEKLSRFAGSDYGRLIRQQFQDNEGKSELAMLVAPTGEELEQFRKAVDMMTPEERQSVEDLDDERIHEIAARASVDSANLAILLNGYVLHCREV
jgi:hypothetical protein